MISDSEYKVQIASCCLEGLIFVILSVPFVVILKRVDFKVERWAMVIQIFYIISALISFLSWMIYFVNGQPTSIIERDPFDCAQDVAELIEHATLFIFIFECQDFYNKIKCDTAQEYYEELRKLKIRRFVAISLNLTMSLSNIGITFYFTITNSYDDTMNTNKKTLLLTSLVLYVLTLTLDLLMAIQFVILSVFLIRAKLEKYKVLGEEMPLK